MFCKSKVGNFKCIQLTKDNIDDVAKFVEATGLRCHINKEYYEVVVMFYILECEDTIRIGDWVVSDGRLKDNQIDGVQKYIAQQGVGIYTNEEFKSMFDTNED